MVEMWRDNRIRVGIWGQELGTRRKRRWKADEHHDDDVNGLSLRDGYWMICSTLSGRIYHRSHQYWLFENLSAFWIEFSRAGFEDFMTLLKLRVPFCANGFARNFMCACTKVFVESTDDFPALSACTSQVKPALLLERAFVSVERTL
jgi:hypothetical protein